LTIVRLEQRPHPINIETMKHYTFTEYFEKKVLRKRPYLTKQMCIQVVESPVRMEVQLDNRRVRFWALVEELNGRALRVITLADKATIHNAFIDRGYQP
jgi:hypothetical protein